MMPNPAMSNESQVSKRSQQAKRELDKLKAELQQLIESGNRNANIPRVVEVSHPSSEQQRNIIKKTDLHPSTSITKLSPIKPCSATDKVSKEKSKHYSADEAREYMKKQKEKRFNSLRTELKSSEQNVELRKQKLKELYTKTRQILSTNVKRSRSRSKSKEKNADTSPGKQKSQHISRKPTNPDVFRVNPDVISNLPSTCTSQSKESIFKNVTIRDKSPGSVKSDTPTPVIIVSEEKDLNKAATKIQATFKGYKQRKRYKQTLLKRTLNSNINLPLEVPKIDLVEENNKQVPKWLESKLSPAPYSVAKTYQRKLFFAANTPETKIQSSDNLLDIPNESRVEIKKILKDNVKNSKNKDLKLFLSHKCLDLDLKKVEELNLISKEKLKSQNSDSSDTSKNIPELSAESISNVEEYSLDINSKRLQELKLQSKNISLRPNQQLIRETKKSNRHLVNTSAKENINSVAESNYKYSTSNTSRKDSSYIPTTVKSIELDSSREITINSSRHLFNPKKLNEMLLLTALEGDLDESKQQTLKTDEKQQEIESVQISENNSISSQDISAQSKSYLVQNANKNQTLSNSDVELEICSNVSKKQSLAKIFISKNQKKSQKESANKITTSEKSNSTKSSKDHSFSHLESTGTDITINSMFESELPTEKSNVLSSTAKPSESLENNKSKEKGIDKILPLKSGEVVTASTNSNQINVRFQAEIHLLNDFNKSLSSLRGIENCLNNLQNPKTIYQNQNTQTSFISSNKSTLVTNSPNKNSVDIQTDQSVNILNSSAVSSGEISLLNGSVFEKFDKISKSMIDEHVNLNETQVSTKIGDISILDRDNNSSLTDGQRPMAVSQEALSLQHFEQLIKDEDARRDYLKTIFGIRKDVLLDRAKVELSMLEIQKKHLIEIGHLTEASAIRKKQRGILIKLQHEKYEMQRLMQMQKSASKERKNLLKEQQNVVKAQLTLNDMPIVSKIKKSHHLDRRSSGPLKVFAPISTQQSRNSTSLRNSDISVSSRRSSSFAEELVVTTSYNSDGGTSVTSITQETSRKTTTVTTAQRDNKNNTDSIIITEINDENIADDSVVCVNDDLIDDSSERRRSKSLEFVNRIVDRNNERKCISEVDVDGENAKVDYFSLGRLEGLPIVDNQFENNKRLLLMREDALQKRRKAAEDLLDWHQRLLEEEKEVAELEMAATSVITHLPLQNKPAFISARTSITEHPQMNILWSSNMTGKGSNESAPETVIPTATSDTNSVKSTEEPVINTKSDTVNCDVQSDIDKSSSNLSEVDKTSSKHSSDSYSCEFDNGDTSDNVEEDEVSLKTVKSSEHDEDLNILKSQSTLNDIMYNISVISEEISEIYRISSGNKDLNIAEDRQLAECQEELENDVDNVNIEEVISIKDDEEQSVAESNNEANEVLLQSELNSVSDSLLIPGSFSSEEADILEQNIKLIEKEIEELQLNTLTSTDIFEDDTSQIKSNCIELQEPHPIDSIDNIATEASELVEKTISIDLSDTLTDKPSVISERISQNNSKIEGEVPEENDPSIPPAEISLEESVFDKSEVLTSKAPDIIESLSRNTEENVDSHSSSKMPEILENLNEDHDEFSEDFNGIAIVNDDIVNTVRMCTQTLVKKALDSVVEESSDVLDDFSVGNDTYFVDKSIENRLDCTYVVTKANISDDVAILDLTLLNNSNKENVSPRYHEDERVASIYGGTKARDSPRNNIENTTSSSNSNSNSNSNHSSIENSVNDDSKSNGTSSKTEGVLNVKKRVSEILADAKQKSDKSRRIQDLYTTTYDVGLTEKTTEIASEVDAEHISPKLVEVKAEELELLKKQWAIEQEIKQLEQQQLSKKREQLPYQYIREIPNKPPPPYTPPVNQLSAVTTPSVIPADVTQLTAVLPVISQYLYSCYSSKSLQTATLPIELPTCNNPDITELVFDLCKELTEQHYEQFRMMDDDNVPSWMRPEESISSLKRPFNEEGLCQYLEEQCVEMYGFKERVNVKESSVMRWSRKKRDHVDEVLVRELQVDESNWTNYEVDERIVSDKLVEDLTDLMLNEVLAELGDWWTAKST